MRVMNLLATIPFPFLTFREAENFRIYLNRHNILQQTRGDYTQIVEALPCDFEDNKWYVVIHTGNLTGMVQDLIDGGWMS